MNHVGVPDFQVAEGCHPMPVLYRQRTSRTGRYSPVRLALDGFSGQPFLIARTQVSWCHCSNHTTAKHRSCRVVASKDVDSDGLS